MLRPTRPLRRSVTQLSTSTAASSKRGSASSTNCSCSSAVRLPPIFAQAPDQGTAALIVSVDAAATAEQSDAAGSIRRSLRGNEDASLGDMTSTPATDCPQRPKELMESIAIKLDSRWVPDYLLQRNLKRQEVDALRLAAHREYLFKKQCYSVRELCRQERIARESLSDTAAGQWEGLMLMASEGAAACGIGKGETKAYMRLQRRLLERQRDEASAVAAKEAQLKEDGRQAWLAEVQSKAQRDEESTALARLRKEQADQFRAAITFIVCRERTERDELKTEHAAGVAELERLDEEGKAEAMRLAQERFENSPEQIALRVEAEKKLAKTRRLAERAERKFMQEQQKFISNCRHAQGGVSMFEGPAPRKVCGRCRVKFDEELGFYIHMDKPRPKPHPGLGAAAGVASKQTSADASLPAASTNSSVANATKGTSKNRGKLNSTIGLSSPIPIQR